MTHDVIVAGAGPAGSMAALVLARRGVRVLIVDRDTFPRDKLCGDTLNPGAVALLASLGIIGGPLAQARPLTGMIVSGPRVSVRTSYDDGVAGLALTRRDLDGWLLEQAIRAGARFESALVARAPVMDNTNGRPIVRGLFLAQHGRSDHVSNVSATITIAADGIRSALARGLKLSTTPGAPRRWAYGAYATGVADVGTEGEMHIRPGIYVGIAPLTDTIANVCVVTGPRHEGRGALDVMRRVIDRDASLAARFAGAQFIAQPRVLGPLARDVSAPGVEGLLLAGDAAGFIDPMTGDGLHLALRGGLLAAKETLRALETSDTRQAVDRLAKARRRELGAKLRFNRVVRSMVGSSAVIGLASCGVAAAPVLMRHAVRYAGDVRGMARQE